ncbi:MAG: chromate transporter [Cyanobacteria bacterium MAG CAR4_bin_6]|nr:chromate transporter [Cyanobacteria bacterium MAG CAR4_bin_6]
MGLQFLEGVSIGQVSLEPVVLTSTFVGYQAGWAAGPTIALLGAWVATATVFLPRVLFILMAHRCCSTSAEA